MGPRPEPADVERPDYYTEDGQADREDLIGDPETYIEAMHAIGRQPVVESRHERAAAMIDWGDLSFFPRGSGRLSVT